MAVVRYQLGLHQNVVPQPQRTERATRTTSTRDPPSRQIASRRAGPADGRLLQVTHASRFDEIAPIYDETRGGEKRGDEYAADIDGLLPQDSGTVLEIGVGTGVVALGLRKRGEWS